MTSPTTTDFLRRALNHHQRGELYEAENLYRQVLEQEPQNADALHLLGRAAHDRGDVPLALDLIHRALAAQPGTATYHNSLGMILGEGGQPEQAEAQFREAIRLDAKHQEAWRNLGKSLLALDRQVRPAGKGAKAAKPPSPAPERDASELRVLGRRLLRQKCLPDALAVFRAAAHLAPRNAQAHADLGHCLAVLERRDEAIAAYDRAFHLDPASAER